MSKTLDELYAQFRPLIRNISRVRSRDTGIDAADLESAMNEALWKAFMSYDPTRGASIEARIDRKVRDAAVDVIRGKNGGYARRVYAVLDAPKNDDEDAPKSEPTNGITAEHEALYSKEKKEADQRQLIDFLCDPTQVDYDTTLIVSSFREVNADGSLRYDSVGALAKALGLHPEIVRRRLHRLSRRYDASRYDITSLLPEGLRIRREFIA